MNINKLVERILYSLFCRRSLKKKLYPYLDEITYNIAKAENKFYRAREKARAKEDSVITSFNDIPIIVNPDSNSNYKETFKLLVYRCYTINVNYSIVYIDMFYEDHQKEIDELIDYYRLIIDE